MRNLFLVHHRSSCNGSSGFSFLRHLRPWTCKLGRRQNNATCLWMRSSSRNPYQLVLHDQASEKNWIGNSAVQGSFEGACWDAATGNSTDHYFHRPSSVKLHISKLFDYNRKLRLQKAWRWTNHFWEGLTNHFWEGLLYEICIRHQHRRLFMVLSVHFGLSEFYNRWSGLPMVLQQPNKPQVTDQTKLSRIDSLPSWLALSRIDSDYIRDDYSTDSGAFDCKL